MGFGGLGSLASGMLGVGKSSFQAAFSHSKSKTKESSFNTSDVQQFSDDVLRELETLFLDELGNYGKASESTIKLAETISGRDFDYDVQPIIRENTRRTENQIAQDYSSLARQAGSDANSLVAAAHSESSADAYSQLAKTSAELEMEAKSKELDDMSKALEAQESATSSILNLGNLLKGANTKSTSFSKGVSSTRKTKISAGVGSEN